MEIKSAFKFLKALKANNQREWFQEHKGEYQELQKQLQEMVEDILRELSGVDSALADIRPEETVFRIYRDVRFSKDKSPYKTHLSAYLSPGGKSLPVAGYYLHIEPGNLSMAAAGIHLPDPALLKKIREAIDRDHDSLQRILGAPDFRARFGALEGPELVRPPKGYDPTHPAIDLLRKKSFTVTQMFKDRELTDDDAFVAFEESFRAAWPLVRWLRERV